VVRPALFPLFPSPPRKNKVSSLSSFFSTHGRWADLPVSPVSFPLRLGPAGEAFFPMLVFFLRFFIGPLFSPFFVRVLSSRRPFFPLIRQHPALGTVFGLPPGHPPPHSFL